MSKPFKFLGNVFKAVKKVAAPVLAVAAIVFTAGAAIPALGVLMGIGTLGGAAAGIASTLGLSTAAGGLTTLGAAVAGAIEYGAYGALGGAVTSAISGGKWAKGAEQGLMTGAALGAVGGATGLLTPSTPSFGPGSQPSLAATAVSPSQIDVSSQLARPNPAGVTGVNPQMTDVLATARSTMAQPSGLARAATDQATAMATAPTPSNVQPAGLLSRSWGAVKDSPMAAQIAGNAVLGLGQALGGAAEAADYEHAALARDAAQNKTYTANYNTNQAGLLTPYNRGTAADPSAPQSPAPQAQIRHGRWEWDPQQKKFVLVQPGVPATA